MHSVLNSINIKNKNMRADIENNQFATMGEYGKYEVLNSNNLGFNMNCILISDENGNKKFIPLNITETTCDIIINPNYIEENE